MDNEIVPSYEEASRGAWTVSPRDSIGVQIANVQRERVHAIVSEHLEDFLQSHIEAGLSKMVYALVPFDSELLGSTEASDVPRTIEKGRASYSQGHFTQRPTAEISNFEEDDYVRAVKLQGPQYSTLFLQQASVLDMMRDQVCHMLGVGQSKPSPNITTCAKDPSKMSKKERREFESAKAVGTLGHGIGWRSTMTSAGLAPGEVIVQVAIEELSIRRATELGMYETRTGNAITVRVQVGS